MSGRSPIAWPESLSKRNPETHQSYQEPLKFWLDRELPEVAQRRPASRGKARFASVEKSINTPAQPRGLLQRVFVWATPTHPPGLRLRQIGFSVLRAAAAFSATTSSSSSVATVSASSTSAEAIPICPKLIAANSRTKGSSSSIATIN